MSLGKRKNVVRIWVSERKDYIKELVWWQKSTQILLTNDGIHPFNAGHRWYAPFI